MRDNNKGLSEIIEVYSKKGCHFAIIKKEINNITKAFEIGISKKSYLCLLKILSIRPFDNIPGLRYRYFHVPSIRRNSIRDIYYTEIRIEQGKNGKQFEVECTKELISNLIWFFELKDFKLTKHLKEINKS
jgi:hypothetical protein